MSINWILGHKPQQNATVMDTEVGARGGEGDAGSTILASGDATVV